MIYFLAFILFFLPSYLIRFQIGGIPTNLLDILIILAILALSIRHYVLRKQDKNLNYLLPNAYYLIPISLFFLAGLISVYVAPDKLSALGYLKSWIILPILFSSLVRSCVKEKRDIYILLAGLLGGGAWVSLHAIFQRFMGLTTLDGRVLGIYGLFPAENASPNFLSLYLTPIAAVALALALGQTIKRKFSIALLLYCSTALLFLLAIYFSGSRGGFLGIVSALLLIAYCLLLYYLPSWKKIWKIGLVLSFIIGLIVVYLWAKPDLSAPPNSGRVATSNNIRFEIWKTSLEIIKQKPLVGVGLGNFQNYFQELTKNRVNYPEFIAPNAYSPHNLFLAVWLNMGLLGLISFIWLLILFFKNFKYSSCEASREAGSRPAGRSGSARNTYYLILITFMVALLVHGLVDTPYFKNDLAILFWLFPALLINATKNKNV